MRKLINRKYSIRMMKLYFHEAIKYGYYSQQNGKM